MRRAERFFRAVYRDNRQRRGADQRVLWGDLLRYARNRALEPLERPLTSWHASRWDPVRAPIVFIVGVPRSGTTLLFQLIAHHLRVAYPTNTMARYWMAPTLAAWRTRRAFDGAGAAEDLTSDLGRASGRFAPHEFGWFWHHWADLSESDDLTDEELGAIRAVRLRAELRGLASCMDRPFVWKSVNFCSYQIAWLQALVPGALFLWMTRDPRFVAQSILQAREDRYCDPAAWWSTRPRDHPCWAERPPEEQVAHQIHDIQRAVGEAMRVLPAGLGVTMTYEDLVRDPIGQLRSLGERIGVEVERRGALARLQLGDRNQQRVSDRRFEAICSALEADE